ncbi:type III polyketide synthase [Marinibactrum halimedae]|uniref:1,3,6,8-tetrahydroxynaphthalene synthase n=1 Tax=Marinibactrum halimedae TaxID=1444977 RepID=A0AA37WMC2_9GAMM|nr:type III polyketide synthase [Marinibactrum halimedae]MCD9457881.1 type III polyketide synthase [Marinibactrum halimedae]GLS26298.1 1,3,6,8-tetrahydroxynaphthalene synthase [Marinibactrum halimedae]
MATVCRPSVVLPQHTISQEQMISELDKLHPFHPKRDLAFKMIRNTQVDNRHLIMPIEELTIHTGLTHRSRIYEREGRRLSTEAAQQAIENAGLTNNDIDMVVVTSCTGFMMPSLTAHLINSLKLKSDTVQLPIAQLGCVAGASAINRAFNFCQANPKANVLIVALEFSSLCFQPDNVELHSFISGALFGDAVTSAVVRGDDLAKGLRLQNQTTYFMQDSEEYISYDVKDSGFHFTLDKAVMNSIQYVAPIMEMLNRREFNAPVADNDFVIFHTGGRKILDELVKHLELAPEKVNLSRESLSQLGNVASAVVFDVLQRQFDAPPTDGSKGMYAAFGPGFTAEIGVGVWQ